MADSTSDAQTVQAFNDVAAVLIPLKANVRGRVHAAVGAALGLGDLPAEPLPAKAPKPRPPAPAPRSAPKPAAAKVPQGAAPSGAPSPKDFWADLLWTLCHTPCIVQKLSQIDYLIPELKTIEQTQCSAVSSLAKAVLWKLGCGNYEGNFSLNSIFNLMDYGI